jgi:hypothetical protein
LTDSVKSVNLNFYELNFILSPHIEAEIKNDFVTIFCKKNREQALLNVYIETVAENMGNKGMWEIENCWVSPRYGVRVESKKLVFRIKIKSDFKFVTFLVKQPQSSS